MPCAECVDLHEQRRRAATEYGATLTALCYGAAKASEEEYEMLARAAIRTSETLKKLGLDLSSHQRTCAASSQSPGKLPK